MLQILPVSLNVVFSCLDDKAILSEDTLHNLIEVIDEPHATYATFGGGIQLFGGEHYQVDFHSIAKHWLELILVVVVDIIWGQRLQESHQATLQSRFKHTFSENLNQVACAPKFLEALYGL